MSNVSMDESLTMTRKESCYSDMGSDEFTAPETDAIPYANSFSFVSMFNIFQTHKFGKKLSSSRQKMGRSRDYHAGASRIGRSRRGGVRRKCY